MRRCQAWACALPTPGRKHFVLVVRYPGDRNPSPRALGVYGAMTLEAARTKGREWLALIANGVDPKVREASRRADTLQAIAEAYLKRESRLRTINQRKSILERLILPKFGARQIEDIRRVEIVALLDRVEDRNGRAMAQYTLATLRRLFTWHAGRSDDFRSPIVRGMSRVKPSEQRRQRTLTDPEIRALWQAAEASPSVFGYFVQLLLLTAVRRNEAAGMGRSEIVGDDWIIPPQRYKTNLELVIPLSAQPWPCSPRSRRSATAISSSPPTARPRSAGSANSSGRSTSLPAYRDGRCTICGARPDR